MPSRVIGQQDRVFLIGILHVAGVGGFRHVHARPCCNMGVITMKMINSTNITSTMGVTLISETAPSVVVLLAIYFFPRDARLMK